MRQRGGPSAVRALDDDRRGKPTSERRGRREECTAGVGHSEERTGDVFGAAPPRDQIGECVPSREADPALSGRSSERADSRDGMPGSSSSLIQVFENKRCGARLVFVYLVEEMPSSPNPPQKIRPCEFTAARRVCENSLLGGLGGVLVSTIDHVHSTYTNHHGTYIIASQ